MTSTKANHYHDDRHPLLSALSDLLPEASCAVAGFASELPPFRSLTPERRRAAMAESRRNASDRCVNSLLTSQGLEPSRALHGPGGDRIWPEGFVGSITHKGLMVMGAIAPQERLIALGIDLERVTPDLVEISEYVAPEGLPRNLVPNLAATLAFSAKEAGFKALYPRTKGRMDFADMRLDWADGDPTEVLQARSVELPSLLIRARFLKPWVIAAAIQKATA